MQFRRKPHGIRRSQPLPPPPPAGPVRSRRARVVRFFVRFFIYSLIVCAIAIAALVFSPLSFKRLDRRIQSEWFKATGTRLVYTKAVIRLNRGTIVIQDPQVLDPKGGAPLLEASRVRLDVPFAQFIFSKAPYMVRGIDIDSPMRVPFVIRDNRLEPAGSLPRLIALVNEHRQRSTNTGGPAVKLQTIRLNSFEVQLGREQGPRTQALALVSDVRVEAEFAGALNLRRITLAGRWNNTRTKTTGRNFRLLLIPDFNRQTGDLRLTLDHFDSVQDLPWRLPAEFNASAMEVDGRLARNPGGDWTLDGRSTIQEINLIGADTLPVKSMDRAEARWSMRLDPAAGRLELTTGSLASRLCTLQTSGSLNLRDKRYDLSVNPLQVQGQIFALVAAALGRSAEIVQPGETMLNLRARMRGELALRLPDEATGRVELVGLNLHTPGLPPLDNLHLLAEMTTQGMTIASAHATVEGLPLTFSGLIRGQPLRGKVASADLNWTVNGDLVSVSTMMRGVTLPGPSGAVQMSGKVVGKGRFSVREPLAGPLVSVLERARLEGRIALSDVTISHPDLLEPISKLKGEVELTEGGRAARLSNGSGQWMGASVALSGTMRGKPLIWNNPRVNLNGSANLDLAATRQRLIDASPQVAALIRSVPFLGGKAALNLTLEGQPENWRQVDYKANLDITDFKTDILAGDFSNGPLNLRQLQLSLSPAQFQIVRAAGRWGAIDVNASADFTPAGGSLRLSTSAEMAEYKRRIPIMLQFFRVGGAAGAEATLTVNTRPEFSPPATWQGWIAALRDTPAPPDWRRWISSRFSFGGGGVINARNAEMTFLAMPARLWGITGPLRFDLQHIWNPTPLPIKGGDKSRDCKGVIDFVYGTSPDEFLAGNPLGTTVFSFTVSGGHLAIDEWLRPWDFSYFDARDREPHKGPSYPMIDPHFQMRGRIMLPSASYRDVAIRDFHCLLDFSGYREKPNRFTWREIRGRIGQGNFNVDGIRLGDNVDTTVAAESIDLEPFIKGMTGKEHASGLNSGKLSGTMKIHQRIVEPNNPPMEGSGQIRVTESKFVSNSIFSSLFGLLKLPILDQISFTTIEGPFQIYDGRLSTKGLTFVNPMIIRLVAAGAYGPAQKLDMDLQLQLGPKFIQNVPIVGGAMGLINKAVGGVFRFKLRGTIENPTLSLLP